MNAVPDFADLEVALSHDWLTGMRGGEKCLEEIVKLFPRSEIHTLVHVKGSVSSVIEARQIRASFLQRVPGIEKAYKYFLPFFPLAARSRRVLPGKDLVISVSHCAAKGISVPEGAKHLCYCLTPMRYAWLFFDEYFGSVPAPFRALIRPVLAALRAWDRAASRSVTRFAAISEHVRERIRAFYGREASVIYPPVDTDFYTPADRPRGRFFVLVSAFVPYKRVDLAIRAANLLGAKLAVIGNGPEEKRLRALAGPTVEFLGWKKNEEIREFYRSCEAVVFPGEEDFGIVPVEAQACGTPVVAFARGGALETVVAGKTGVFFTEPTAASLAAAMKEAAARPWDRAAIRAHAEKFSAARFRREFAEAVKETLSDSRHSDVYVHEDRP